MKISKSVAAFRDACRAGLVTEGRIRGARHMINRAENGAARMVILDEVEAGRPRVSQAQCDKGRAYLLKTNVTKAGKLRKGAFLTLAQVEIVREADCAKLVGFEDVGTGRYSYFLPVYRYVMAGGACVTYVACSWQSGRKPWTTGGY